MKFLILNFLLVFTLGNANADINASYVSHSSFEEEVFAGGTIIMVDEVLLRVNSGNSSITINDIEVFDQGGNLVMQVQGCSLQECTTDLSSLVAGTYDITVVTSNNHSFSGTVTLN